MSSNMYPSGFSPPYMLRVNTRTWMRDSHDLFDYETHQQVKISNFATSAAFKLLRCESDVSVMEYNNIVEKEHDHLLSIISKRKGEYIVVPAEKIPGSLLYPQKLWLIVRTLPYQRYALQENDIIKLGRFRLRVKQLVPSLLNDNNSNSIGDTSILDPITDSQLVKLFDGVIPEKTITYEEQCNMQCRICLSEGYLYNPNINNNNTPTNLMSTSNDTSLDIDTTTSKMNTMSNDSNPTNSNTSSITTLSDPNLTRTISNITDLNLNKNSFESDRLICACECKGSIKYVHVDCLRKWIDSRWNLRSDEPLPSMVFIREVSCELCKTNYPCFIKQNGELIQIVKMPKMAVPFLVLENITPHAIKGVHLLSMKDMKDLKLGRGHESDVRIPDVSISRYHATIRYEQGQFYLEDHDSKFGTLVAMRKPKLISINEPLAVQVGRSVINLSIDESLPYLQNSVITLTPSVNTGTINNVDNLIKETDNKYNNNNNNNNNNIGLLNNNNNINNIVNDGSRIMVGNVGGTNGYGNISGLGAISGLSGNLCSIDSRISVDLLDYSLGTYNYPTYLTSYSNHIHNTNTVSNNSSQMSISPSPTVSSSNTPSNIINTLGCNNNNNNIGLLNNNNNNNISTNTPTNILNNNSPTNVLTTNTGVNNFNSVSSSGSGMNDLYWMVRNASRQRYDQDTLDGLNNNRINNFRAQRVTSSSRNNSVNINSNTQHINTINNNNNNQVITNTIISNNNNNNNNVDMLLPESVFIANWNNLPTRNMDLNVDTSSSALDNRHSTQDLDKPITRL